MFATCYPQEGRTGGLKSGKSKIIVFPFFGEIRFDFGHLHTPPEKVGQNADKNRTKKPSHVCGGLNTFNIMTELTQCVPPQR